MEKPTTEQMQQAAEETDAIPLVQALALLFEMAPPTPQDLAAWCGAAIMTVHVCGTLDESDVRMMIAELIPHA